MIQIVIDHTPDDMWMPVIEETGSLAWGGKPELEADVAFRKAHDRFKKIYCAECDSVSCTCAARSRQ